MESEPMRSRVMFSTPQATTHVRHAGANQALAEHGGLLGGAALSVYGDAGSRLRPAAGSQAVRTTFMPWAPSLLMQPPTT